MRHHAQSAFATAGLCCLLLSGCLSNPDLEEIEEVVARELEPATLETTIKLELGPGFLSLVKLLCN